MEQRTERGTRSPNKVSVKILYQQKNDSWNNGNGEKFAGLYTDDSDYVGFDGTYLNRPKEIASFHHMLFDRFLKASRLVGMIKVFALKTFKFVFYPFNSTFVSISFCLMYLWLGSD